MYSYHGFASQVPDQGLSRNPMRDPGQAYHVRHDGTWNEAARSVPVEGLCYCDIWVSNWFRLSDSGFRPPCMACALVASRLSLFRLN